MRLVLCFLVLAALVGAADTNVTGKWSGSFNTTGPNGETRESTAVMVLKQSGTDITGTVGPSEDDQVAIQKGKIDGANITLEAEREGTILKFTLLVTAPDRITGEAERSHEGQTAKAKIDVTRAK